MAYACDFCVATAATDSRMQTRHQTLLLETGQGDSIAVEVVAGRFTAQAYGSSVAWEVLQERLSARNGSAISEVSTYNSGMTTTGSSGRGTHALRITVAHELASAPSVSTSTVLEDVQVAPEEWITASALAQSATVEVVQAAGLIAVVEQVETTAQALDWVSERALASVQVATVAMGDSAVTHRAQTMDVVVEHGTSVSAWIAQASGWTVTEAVAQTGSMLATQIEQQVTSAALAVTSVEDGVGGTDLQSQAIGTATVIEQRTALNTVVERAHGITVLLESAQSFDLVREMGVGQSWWVDTASLVAGLAWSAPVRTFGMSRYSPYAFTSAAVLDRVELASGDDGLYALDDPTLGTLTARIHTVETDFAVEGQAAGLRQVTAVYPSGVMTQPQWSARVDGQHDGSYRARREQTGKAKFGRGLKGRYWAFALEAEALELRSIQALVHDYPRRY